MFVDNPSALVADVFCTTDARGGAVAVAIVKGTWQRGPDGLTLSDDQLPTTPSPVYRAEPGASSLLRDTDRVPHKPGTDCLLAGHACADGATQTEVSYTVADGDRVRAEQRATVSGPRQWQATFGTTRIIGPMSFDRVALTWENAYGGTDATPDDPDRRGAHVENPVGVGFRASGSRTLVDGAWLPQIEAVGDALGHPGGRVRAVGFGPVAPGWAPRTDYAGTYDEAWRATRAPLLPIDFDARFYQSAPPSLVATPHLEGGETVTVDGCRDKRWTCTVPTLSVRVGLVAGVRPEVQDAVLDTLCVDTDDDTVEAIWRATFPIQGRIDAVEGVVVRVEGLDS